RGRATRIRKRTCHITIIVSRGTAEQLRIRNERIARSGRATGGAANRASRRARVAKSRGTEHTHDHDHDHDDEVAETEATDTEAAEVETDEVATVETGEIKGNA